MLVTLYINTLPVDTLRESDKVVYVEVVKLWKTLKIREYYSPIPVNQQFITNDSDKSYTIGGYCTVEDTMTALRAVPVEGFEDPTLGAIMLSGLEEVLSRFWATQPEFTPLY